MVGDMGKMRRIGRDVAIDGYWLVSAFAPLLSIVYTVLKALDLETPMRDWLRETSYAWALLPLVIWLAIAYCRRHAAFAALADRDDFAADLNPKEALRYLCEDTVWSERFDNEHKLFNAARMGIRDELVSSRLRAKGRPSGKWSDDGDFRYPTDFIEPQWWKHGDLNWVRILNWDYSGDIDAYDPGYSGTKPMSFDDVMLCRREVEAVWPAKGRIRRWWRPPKFQTFVKVESTSPPWSRPTVVELAGEQADVTRQAPQP